MTAWLNYYLHLQSGYYTYLYGAEADADVSAGSIVQQVDTATRALQASGRIDQIVLMWQPYEHPIVSGYNVYRKTGGTNYGEAAYAQLGTMGIFTDADVIPAQVYTYTVCSYDAAGNEHQYAADANASAITQDVLDEWIYLPIVITTLN